MDRYGKKGRFYVKKWRFYGKKWRFYGTNDGFTVKNDGFIESYDKALPYDQNGTVRFRKERHNRARRTDMPSGYMSK